MDPRLAAIIDEVLEIVQAHRQDLNWQPYYDDQQELLLDLQDHAERIRSGDASRLPELKFSLLPTGWGQIPEMAVSVCRIMAQFARKNQAGYGKMSLSGRDSVAAGRPDSRSRHARAMMRRAWVTLTAACAAALLATAGCATTGPATPVAATGLAGTSAAARAAAAIEVPGTAALNKGADASVLSVSCASAGNCGAGGYYSHKPGAVVDFGIFPGVPQGYEAEGAHAFVVSQVHGTWGRAIPVRFPASMHAVGGWVQVVACPALGYCSAAGTYAAAGGARRPFTVSEVHGRWGSASPLSGTQAFRNGSVSVISCPSAGNCGAGGAYQDPSGHRRMFLVSEVHGAWHAARPIRNVFASHNFNLEITGLNSMSCSSTGNCAAGGSYQVPDPKVPGVWFSEAFVVTEVNGTWGTAIEVPGTAVLNTGGNAVLTTVSCAAPGDCGAGGSYQGQGPGTRAFAVSETHGRWGRAIRVPGTAATGPGVSAAFVYAMSCRSAGNCSAGGFAGVSTWVTSEVNGQWRTVTALSSPSDIARNARLRVVTMACGSPGNCAVAGEWATGARSGLFVTRQVHGQWTTQVRVAPGPVGLLRHRLAAIPSVACDPAGNCSAGGNYPDGKVTSIPHGEIPHLQAVVVSEHR
jgi:hypothetical protein